MAPSRDDLASRLARLEHEIDEEEYSLLNAPPARPPPILTSTAGPPAGRAAASSNRGESFYTPSAASATAPQDFQGGSYEEREEAVATPSAQGAVPCFFLSSYTKETACLGRIGSSDRACAGERLPGELHCGVKEHAKKKASVQPDAFYAPTGSIRGKSTFKTDPFVRKVDIAPNLLPTFETGLFKTMQWVHLIIDAAIPEPKLDLDLKAGVQEGEDGSHQSYDFSTISAMEPFASSSVKYENFVLGEEFGDDADWRATANEHRASMNELGGVINRVGEHFPKLYSKVNMEYRRLLNRVNDDIKVLKADKIKLQSLLGDFTLLAKAHGSAAEAVHDAFVDINGQRSDISHASSDRDSIRSSLAANVKRLEEDSLVLLRVIKKVGRTSSTHARLLNARLDAIEQARARVGPSPRDFLGDDSRSESSILEDIYGTQHQAAVPSRGTSARTAIDANTSFGQIEIGGNTMDLTMNTMFSMIKDLEAKLSVGMDRQEGQGIIFHDWAFPSELEFDLFFAPLNSVGRGPAAFVDIISAWSFASLEQISAADFLQMKHRAVATGLGTNVEAQYTTSMQNKYPVPFVGTVETVLATDVIKCFRDLKSWQGNGLGDGVKERLVSALRVGIARHRRYCLDNLPLGPLRDHAIKSGEFSLDFFQAFVSHADDEINMLITLGLKEKQVMLLVSSQLIQICDDLFELRQDAANVDTTNKGLTAVRFAWVTLRALNKMADYLHDKFKNVFAGTFVRFLTTQIAEINPTGSWKEKSTAFDTKLTALGGRITKLKDDSATKESLQKVDKKLEAVVRLNSLKKSGNGPGRRNDDGIEDIP